MRRSTLATVLAAALPMLSGRAEVVALTPVADTMLIEAAPTNSAGGQAFFNAGTTQNLTRDRGLLRFDLAAAGIPTDATIVSAALDVQVVGQPSAGQVDSLFGLHRLLQGWGEGSNVATDNNGGRGAPALPGDATWLSRFAGTPQAWGAPGGAPSLDYVFAFSSSTIVSGVGPYHFESTLDMVADAQFWAAHPEANFGWMLISESEDTAFTARRFASRENPGGGPVLTLEFTVVPEPAGLAWLFLGTILAVLMTKR